MVDLVIQDTISIGASSASKSHVWTAGDATQILLDFSYNGSTRTGSVGSALPTAILFRIRGALTLTGNFIDYGRTRTLSTISTIRVAIGTGSDPLYDGTASPLANIATPPPRMIKVVVSYAATSASAVATYSILGTAR